MSAIVHGAEIIAEEAVATGKAAASTAGKVIQTGAKSVVKTTQTAGKQLGKILPRSVPKKAVAKPKPKTKFYLATRTRPPVNRKH